MHVDEGNMELIRVCVLVAVENLPETWNFMMNHSNAFSMLASYTYLTNYSFLG